MSDKRSSSSRSLHERRGLKEARLQHNWSQREVATRLNTTYAMVSRWEKGYTTPGRHYRERLCALFQKSAEELDLASESEEQVHLPIDPLIPELPPAPMVGREAEMQWLQSALIDSQRGNHFIALSGLPGVGKTRLAMALVHDEHLRAHFDCILWAWVSPQPTLRHYLLHWGHLLGLTAEEMDHYTSQEAWSKAFQHVIKDRHLLIILDDVWTLQDIKKFLIGGTHCTYLITTRFPRLAAQMSSKILALQELSEEQSMTLLKHWVPLLTTELQHCSALAQAAGGLPFALNLMGLYLRPYATLGQKRRFQMALHSLGEAKHRLTLSDPRPALENHPSLSGERPHSLESLFAVSDHLLDQRARQILYALTEFPPKPHRFSEEDALSRAHCTVEDLDRLYDSGLLESDGQGHYLLHRVVADYVRLHYGDEKKQGRHETYQHLLRYMEGLTKTRETDQEHLAAEIDLTRATITQARKCLLQDRLIRWVIESAPFWLARGFYGQVAQLLEESHKAAKALAHPEEVTILHLRGQLAQKQGHYAQAEELFLEALTLAQRACKTRIVCGLLGDLGWVLWKQGHYSQANELLQEGLELAREVKSDEQLCKILRILGSVCCAQGAFQTGIEYLEEGLQIAQRLAHPEYLCVLLIDLGTALLERGQYDQAERHLLKSLLLARQDDLKEWQSLACVNLAELALSQEQYDQAHDYAQEGLHLAQDLDNPEWIAIHTSNLAIVRREQRHYSQAQQLFQQALERARQLGRRSITACILYESALLALDQMEVEEAESLLEEMQQTIPREDRVLWHLWSFAQARLLAIHGKRAQAVEQAQACWKHLTQLQSYKRFEIERWLKTLMHYTEDAQPNFLLPEQKEG
jgi:tetratricopeptide (TPR) repeat protein/transcriptional regulator with XRE-family HTH domain